LERVLNADRAMRPGPVALEEREYATLAIERVASGVAVVTLARPDRLNALSEEMLADLVALAADVERDAGLRCLVLTGAGRAFSAGGDYAALQALSTDSVSAILERLDRGTRAISAVQAIRVPVIAAVNGPAAGGGLALALVADVRLASPDVVFVAPFVELGISACDVGLSWLLPRTIGLGRASELMLTGRQVAAAEAERIGLVNRVVPAADLLDEALVLAHRIAAGSRLAQALTKEGLRLGVDAPSLEAAIALENRQQALTLHADELGRLRGLG
jgi:enoyl-CoA hydratase/carnithine racemase